MVILFRRLMRAFRHLDVDELQGRGGLFQHAPTLQPVVGALHLVERDRRRIAALKVEDLRESRLVVCDPDPSWRNSR